MWRRSIEAFLCAGACCLLAAGVSPAIANTYFLDADRDGDGDLRDAARWQNCFENGSCDDLLGCNSGPVDLSLFLDFLQAMTGPRPEDFPNGVAAGDVDQTSVILLARAGWVQEGVADTVRFEYGTDECFASIDGFADVEVSDLNIPAKVEINSLSPGTQYYYRACRDGCPDAGALQIGGEARGSFRTPFSVGHHGLRFGVSSCWRGDMRPFVSISNIPNRDLDFFVALGDTVYADSSATCSGVAETLEDFRCKYRLAYSQLLHPEDNLFARARASTAFFVDIDDHEVTDNFSGGEIVDDATCSPGPPCFQHETQIYKDALQAFHEHNPIREEHYGATGDARTAHKGKLYRHRTFGKDAAIFMLDVRSFRDAPLQLLDHPYYTLPPATYLPDRTMVSAAQLSELKQDLQDAEDNGITWKFVLVPEPIQNLGPVWAADRYEGYAYERGVLLDFIETACIDNVVFISGDIHGTIVNNLRYKRSALDLRRYSATWDVSTGPGAYAAPYGPTLIDHTSIVAEPLTGYTYDDYLLLDRDAQNLVINELTNEILDRYGYTRTGFDNDPPPKLPILQEANALIPANLLQGSYVATNTFGWAEFEIDAATKKLTVTVYGIDWYEAPKRGESYSEKEVAALLSRMPFIMSRFEIATGCGCQENLICLNDQDCCDANACSLGSCVRRESLANGEICGTDAVCKSGLCVLGLCGGCQPIGDACLEDEDCCNNHVCSTLVCVGRNSLDALTPCGKDSACRSDSCVSGQCESLCGDGICEGTEVCGDGNAGLSCETDCGLCPFNFPCDENADCKSKVCFLGLCGCQPVDGLCTATSECCNDNVCNLLSCTKRNSLSALEPCDTNAACRSGTCFNGLCAQVCGDGFCDGTETCGNGQSLLECQTDCGRCPNGTVCFEDGDCQSDYCVFGSCGPCQTIGSACLGNNNCCNNNICNLLFCVGRNSLPALTPCDANAACRSGSCVAGLCEQVCGDNWCDGTEICGGGNSGLECRDDCGRCPNGTACVQDNDCQSGNCCGFTCRGCRCIGSNCSNDGQCCSGNCVLSSCVP